MAKIIFITGGARSGKSTYAEKFSLEWLTKESPRSKIAYIATGVAVDEEFKSRIELHRQRRNEIFQTCEESLNIADELAKQMLSYPAILLECLTTWLGNVFYEKENKSVETFALKQIEKIIQLAINKENKMVVIVSNEIGLGIVPADEKTRLFRDMLGRVNQKVASRADEVYFCVSGIPMRIK